MAGFFRYPLAKAQHKGRIWGVYVRESCRGRGIGRDLLVALLEKIRTCPGVEQVSLTVVSGQEAARALYRSFGFEPYGLEPRGLKVGSQYFDNEHMVLRLP
jgi:ribosomal protein S18 acetylase RimI-like enzyme